MLVSVELELRKGSSVTLDRLANPSLSTVQLHGTLNFERRGIRRVTGNTDQDEPFLVGAGAVVDDLSTNEGGVPVEYLLRW